jgi:S1-C subfamily serine protease
MTKSMDGKFQRWGIDPLEAEYAMANVDQIMSQVQFSAYADGGVKVNSVAAGSMPALRGLQEGDVVRSINKIPINNAGEVQNLFQSGKFRRGNVLRVTVQRAGQDMTIEYRMQRVGKPGGK